MDRVNCAIYYTFSAYTQGEMERYTHVYVRESAKGGGKRGVWEGDRDREEERGRDGEMKRNRVTKMQRERGRGREREREG